MTDHVQRLRESKKVYQEKLYEKGRENGGLWGRDCASYEELQLLREFLDRARGEDDPFNADGESYTPGLLFMRTIRPDEFDGYSSLRDSDEFWGEQEEGEPRIKALVLDSQFMLGFAQGAVGVLDESEL